MQRHGARVEEPRHERALQPSGARTCRDAHAAELTRVTGEQHPARLAQQGDERLWLRRLRSLINDQVRHGRHAAHEVAPSDTKRREDDARARERLGVGVGVTEGLAHEICTLQDRFAHGV